MRSRQYLAELRALDMAELDHRLREVRTELFNLRFQVATGQLENHRQIRRVRRQIAEVLTVKRGREMGLEQMVAETSAPLTSSAPPAPAAVPAEAATEVTE